jgi:adenylate cyclase
VKQVGEELEVDYVLEGSVRKAGNRVRITAQLIDAGSDHHLWSERYDRELEDIFAVQDEITANIVTALNVSLLEGEQARLWRKSTHNGQAYDLFLRGRNAFIKTFSREGSSQAVRLIEQAIELDPAFARAYAGLARQFLVQVRNGWSQAPEESLARALDLTNRAIALDESLAYGYSARSHYFRLKGDFEQALADGEKAVALSPEGAAVTGQMAQLQIFTGEVELAVENLRKAMRLAPGYHAWYPFWLGLALVMLGRFEEALASLQEASKSSPDFEEVRLILAAALAGLGREQEARDEAQKFLRVTPRFSLQEWAAREPFKNPADLEHLVGLLRKAGLPD